MSIYGTIRRPLCLAMCKFTIQGSLFTRGHKAVFLFVVVPVDEPGNESTVVLIHMENGVCCGLACIVPVVLCLYCELTSTSAVVLSGVFTMNRTISQLLLLLLLLLCRLLC